MNLAEQIAATTVSNLRTSRSSASAHTPRAGKTRALKPKARIPIRFV